MLEQGQCLGSGQLRRHPNRTNVDLVGFCATQALHPCFVLFDLISCTQPPHLRQKLPARWSGYASKEVGILLKHLDSEYMTS